MNVNRSAHAAFLLAILIFSLLLIRIYQNDRSPSGPEPVPVIIDVQGDVRAPGVYLLEASPATVADALKAAGGVRSKASVGLPEHISRQVVRSGQSIRVVSQPSDEVGIRMEPMAASARLTIGRKLDLNEATIDDLRLIPHMKPEMASAIVERRKKKAWQNILELREISGIGPKTIEKWKPYLEAGNR